MHDLTEPLLAKNLSASTSCPNCGHAFASGFAYLSGGALLLSAENETSNETERLQAFLSIGFHGKDSEMQDSTDATLVDDVIGGQFDLNWCSIACMRFWLNRLMDEMENRLPRARSDS